MRLPTRTILFAAVATGMWVADGRYHDAVLSPAATNAAVRQADGDGAAALGEVQRRGTWADRAAVAGTTLAAIACLATWRPRPLVTLIDKRNQE